MPTKFEQDKATIASLRRQLHHQANEIEDLEDDIRAWRKWARDHATPHQVEDLIGQQLLNRHFLEYGI